VRVLLTGPITGEDPSLQCLLSDPQAETVWSDPLSPTALEQIADGTFDGIVCRADGTEAITQVSRIRGRNTAVPILVLSTRADPRFETEALLRGASWVVSTDAGAAAVAENVRRMLALHGAARDFQAHLETNQRLRAELTEAVLQRKSISQFGGHIQRSWLRRGLLPLLIENDPEEALRMAKAFEMAGLHAPLPILRSPQEALAYLQGAPPYENRNLYPLPNTLLLDLTPISLGLEFLRWVRQQKEFCSLPVIVLSKSASPEEVGEIYGNLANSFLIKPDKADQLVVLVQFIEIYWTQMNLGAAF